MHPSHNFLYITFANLAYGLSAFFDLMPSPANIVSAGVLALVTSSVAFLVTKAWNIIFKTKEKDNEDK